MRGEPAPMPGPPGGAGEHDGATATAEQLQSGAVGHAAAKPGVPPGGGRPAMPTASEAVETASSGGPTPKEAPPLPPPSTPPTKHRRKVPDEVEPKQEDDQTWWQASWPQDARDWSWQRSWSQWGPPVTSGNPRGHGYYHGNVYVDSWGVARPQLGLRFEQTSVWRPRIGAGRQRARTRGGRHIREHQNLIEAVTTMAATMNSLTGRR